MDERRKRLFTIGMILGTLTVGLAILLRKTPRAQLGSTLDRIGRDLLGFARTRYGDNPAITMAEKALDKFK
jgi:hypothetical protein